MRQTSSFETCTSRDPSVRISSYMAEISYLKGRIRDLEKTGSPQKSDAPTTPQRRAVDGDRTSPFRASLLSIQNSPTIRGSESDVKALQLEVELGKLRRENSELNAYANTLRSEFERYRQMANEKIKAKNEEIRTLQAQLDQAMKVIMSRERVSSSNVRSSLDHKQEVDDLRAENEELRKRNDVLRRQLVVSGGSRSESGNATSDSDLFTLVRELRNENKALKENLSQLNRPAGLSLTRETLDEFSQIKSPIKSVKGSASKMLSDDSIEDDRMSIGSTSSNQEDERLSRTIQELRQQIGKMMDDGSSEEMDGDDI